VIYNILQDSGIQVWWDLWLRFVTNLLLSLLWKNLFKSVNIWRSYG